MTTCPGQVKRGVVADSIQARRALDLSLTQVAFACGFASSSDFSRSFRARHGVSPRGLDIDRFRSERRADMLETLAPQRRHQLAGLRP